MASNNEFSVLEGDDILSPKTFIELPRPGTGTPNPGYDLAFIPVSTHSFKKEK